MGLSPKYKSIELIKEKSLSPNISRKATPATITEVKAGRKRIERKVFLAIMFLELRVTA
jgi:hypothetical protein